ncbi:MAG TPA: hypothetical protein EYP60_01550 [bacterium (Candidatus Stahlbacteria)]|nr:hypothetical protein [Candidatus Stahlbacteria bacterium]
MARNRIIYASQSVWCNGEVLYRVQSLGSTTTFTSEDIFELGHLDIVDVVDDVPAVAVTLNTNDFGDVRTLAVLAQLPAVKRAMDATADSTTGNLVVVSGTDYTPTSTYLHGVSLADFAVVCGNLPGVTMWAPVQDECSLGTLDNNIDQTLFLDEVYVNSLEFGYTTGANATENYGAETDMKMWLLNGGRFVNYDSWTLDAGDIAAGYVTMTIASGTTVADLSSGNKGFLRKDADGAPAATWYNADLNEITNTEVVDTALSSTEFYYSDSSHGGTHQLYFPTGAGFAVGDIVEAIYAADAYGTGTSNTYFTTLSDVDRPDMLGALRQGQVEVHIVDPNNPGVDYEVAWRLTGCTITCDLTREALAELGHLGPYDRPLTLPIPITVTVDSTAGDLENWSKVAGQLAAFDGGTLNDIDLADLMAEEDLKLVVKVYAQTDEEAGGTGGNRTVATDSPLVGQSYWVDGTEATYSAGNTEYPLKTIIVEHLKITDEGATLDMGANMTQTFGFRSTNDLYVVKGAVSLANITGDFTIRRS